mmetsp:Transcript_46610/g.89009  ORF Transcript_46610/g.89009 Transcript_46610/m.89009 type:complete len:204 (+) Transcript_46610:910-1521(+)
MQPLMILYAFSPPFFSHISRKFHKRSRNSVFLLVLAPTTIMLCFRLRAKQDVSSHRSCGVRAFPTPGKRSMTIRRLRTSPAIWQWRRARAWRAAGSTSGTSSGPSPRSQASPTRSMDPRTATKRCFSAASWRPSKNTGTRCVSWCESSAHTGVVQRMPFAAPSCAHFTGRSPSSNIMLKRVRRRGGAGRGAARATPPPPRAPP